MATEQWARLFSLLWLSYVRSGVPWVTSRAAPEGKTPAVAVRGTGACGTLLRLLTRRFALGLPTAYKGTLDS